MSVMRKMQAVMKLGAVPLFGPARVRKLIDQLALQDSSLEYLVEFGHSDLVALGLSAEQAAIFIETDTQDMADAIHEGGISFLVHGDPDAPAKLRDLRLTPWMFYSGDPSILNRESIGFSGSRDATPDAIRITREIAAAASGYGWSVISGGARGVDLAAHSAAIDAGVSTVVILPQGIATWRRPEELDSDRTLVISEFMPFDDWGNYRAMQRNKSIVHLSDRLVIPQAGERGGTRNAGEYAIQRGHPTWVVDMGDNYPGNNALIRKGAKSLDWVRDSTAFENLLLPETSAAPAQQSLF